MNTGFQRHPRAQVWAAAVTVFLALAASSAHAAGVFINVTQAPYNAAGDGVTNDRLAIQQAIIDANGAGGGTVDLPGGFTFLTGDLQLLSGVTLEIDAGATLLQSRTPTDYAHPPQLGRSTGSGIKFDSWAEHNFPLIYALQATNVAITGSGTVRMNYTGDDATSIVENAVGFSLVSGFSVSGITVSGAMAYNFTIRNCDHGTISNVQTVQPATINSDGVSLMDSSFIDVHDNKLTTLDDAIYVWASYLDPRRSAWWDSDTPRASHDINIYNNVVQNQSTNGSHGFAFINWTAAACDQSQVEVSRINVHDNQFSATFPMGALVGDPYNDGCGNRQQKTPTKDLTFLNNELSVVGNGAPFDSWQDMATTDFSADDPGYFVVGLATDATGLYNSDFNGLGAFSAEIGTSFWSTEGDAGASNESVGQPGTWFGTIRGFENGYSGIYQGVYLQPGTYTFTATVQSSGANVRLFAIEASTLAALPGTIVFNNTDWQTLNITFTVATTGTYRLGIDDRWSFGAVNAFGRIGATSLTKNQ